MLQGDDEAGSSPMMAPFRTVVVVVIELDWFELLLPAVLMSEPLPVSLLSLLDASHSLMLLSEFNSQRKFCDRSS
jgi:hypothetical protein